MRMKVMALLSALFIVPQLARAQAIHVRQSPAGTAIFEVHDATVSIRKELSHLTSVVTMATPRGDVLRIAIGPTGVVADNEDSTTVAPSKTPMAGEMVMTTIRTSRAASAARALLAKVTLDPQTPAGNVMLLTRALLEASQDESMSALKHQAWARATASAAGLVRSADDSTAGVEEDADGPGDCWAEYSKYAVEVWDDYINCLSEIRWYDIFGEYRCEAIYVLRAELAFMWLINCSGPFPFKG